MDDFQYLTLTPDNDNVNLYAGYCGPTFYIQPQCSVCELPCANLFCAACVKRGHFYLYDRQSEPRSFKEICDEFRQDNIKISFLYKQILAQYNQNPKKDCDSEIVALEQEIELVKADICKLENSAVKKKEELARKRREARQLVAAKAEINKKEIRLREYSIRLEAETKGISFRFMKINKFIHELRRDNIRELFEKYLPIKASSSSGDLDTIAGTKLNVDSRNLTVPEPTISSHAALTLMIVAQRALTRILNACIPVDTRQIFNLNTFEVNSPTRDNITHVYRVVCQLIQVLVEISARQPFSSESSKYAGVAREMKERPLLALHYLVKAFKRDTFQSWAFDSPYLLSSADIFSSIDYEIALCPHPRKKSVDNDIAIRIRRTVEKNPSYVSLSVNLHTRKDDSSSDSDEWDIVDDDDM